MKSKPKPVEYKETNEFDYTPKYQYPVSITNRYVFAWETAKKYKGTINYALNFQAPNKIICVYLFGQVDKEKIKKHISDKERLLVIHFPDPENIVGRIDELRPEIERLGKSGRDLDYLKSEIDKCEAALGNADKSSRQVIEACLKDWGQEYSNLSEWLTLFDKFKTQWRDSLVTYGLREGYIPGDEEAHFKALTEIAKRTYPSGIEVADPVPMAYKTLRREKLALSGLKGETQFDINNETTDRFLREISYAFHQELSENGFVDIFVFKDKISASPYGFYECNWYSYLFALILSRYRDLKKYFAHIKIYSFPVTDDNLKQFVLCQSSGSAVSSRRHYAPGIYVLFKETTKQKTYIKTLCKVFGISPVCATLEETANRMRTWLEENLAFSCIDFIDERLSFICNNMLDPEESDYFPFRLGYENDQKRLESNLKELKQKLKNADNELFEYCAEKYGRPYAEKYYKYSYHSPIARSWVWKKEDVLTHMDE